MNITFKKQHERIAYASKTGWDKFRAQLTSEAKNELVKVEWDVIYHELGHDIIIEAFVKVVDSDDILLQVWLQDTHPGIWIPEFRPWVSSVVEFMPEQNIKKAHIGLFDSKWRKEDVGEIYHALLWGYLNHAGEVASFAFEKEFKYPG